MTIDVKICGINSAAAAETAIEAGADYLGFVFFAPSPRHLDASTAVQIAACVPDGVRKVALLVDPTNADIDAAVAAIDPEFIQLHGSETPQRMAQLRARTGRPVIKALKLGTIEDAAAARLYADADMQLFDARPPKGATRPGGHGATFDWSLLAGVEYEGPWFLSGGLDPDNVLDAIRATGARAVDVSSGVETAPGVKDASLIRRFVSAAKSAA